MSLLSRLFLLFIGVPLLELYLLIKLGQWVGLWPTIGLVVITGAAGAALARLEGLRAVWKVRADLAQGRLPGNALLDGLAILVGGALLLTPGVLTDFLGFSLILPVTRGLYVRRVRKALDARLRSGEIRVTRVQGFPWPDTEFRGETIVRPQAAFGGEGPHPREGEIVVEPKEEPGR